MAQLLDLILLWMKHIDDSTPAGRECCRSMSRVVNDLTYEPTAAHWAAQCEVQHLEKMLGKADRLSKG